MTGSNDPVQWDDRPPLNDTRWIPIVSPQTGPPLTLWVCNHHVVGAWTHWWEERTVPCLGESCPLKNAGDHIPPRWKGYLGCVVGSADRLCMLELTIEAVRSCSLDLEPDGDDLRGLQVTAWRLGTRRNAALRVQFNNARRINPPMPEPFDAQAALRRIWFGATRE